MTGIIVAIATVFVGWKKLDVSVEAARTAMGVLLGLQGLLGTNRSNGSATVFVSRQLQCGNRSYQLVLHFLSAPDVSSVS
jgi:heme A synthase